MILKFFGTVFFLLISCSAVHSKCYFFPFFHCELDTQGQAPANNCGTKLPWLMSYQLKNDEHIYVFRKDCGASWGKNAWNVIVITTSTWKSDGTTKQVAEWRAEADHPLMTSVVTGSCTKDPWINTTAICSKKDTYYTVSSGIIGKNGMPDILYHMYKEILEQYTKDPFPNTATLIPGEKRTEILMESIWINMRELREIKIPFHIPQPN